MSSNYFFVNYKKKNETLTHTYVLWEINTLKSNNIKYSKNIIIIFSQNTKKKHEIKIYKHIYSMIYIYHIYTTAINKTHKKDNLYNKKKKLFF